MTAYSSHRRNIFSTQTIDLTSVLALVTTECCNITVFSVENNGFLFFKIGLLNVIIMSIFNNMKTLSIIHEYNAIDKAVHFTLKVIRGAKTFLERAKFTNSLHMNE